MGFVWDGVASAANGFGHIRGNVVNLRLGQAPPIRWHRTHARGDGRLDPCCIGCEGVETGPDGADRIGVGERVASAAGGRCVLDKHLLAAFCGGTEGARGGVLRGGGGGGAWPALDVLGLPGLCGDRDGQSMVPPSVVAVASFVFSPVPRLHIACGVSGSGVQGVVPHGELGRKREGAPGIGAEVGAFKRGEGPGLAAIERDLDLRYAALARESYAVEDRGAGAECGAMGAGSVEPRLDGHPPHRRLGRYR